MFRAPSKTKGPQSCQPIGGIDGDWIMHYAFTVLALLDRVARADEMPCSSIASRLLWTSHLGELDSQRDIVTGFQKSPESEDRRSGDQVGDFRP